MCITQVQIYDYTHSCGHKLGPNTRQSIAPCPIALARRENSSDQGYSCYHCPEVIYTYPVDPCESCKQHGHWVWDFDVYDFVQVAAGVLGEESSAKAGDAEMDVECSSWNTMPVSPVIYIKLMPVGISVTCTSTQYTDSYLIIAVNGHSTPSWPVCIFSYCCKSILSLFETIFST